MAAGELSRDDLARAAQTETALLEQLRDAAAARVGEDRARLLFGAAAERFHELFAAAGAEDYYPRGGGR